MNENTVSVQHQEAVTLHQSILTNAQLAMNSIVEMCKGLKKMQTEKLYTELGYESFEDYTEQAVGIKRSQAYKYIKVLDNLGEDFVHSNAQLGISKLALIAAVEIKDDREEMLKENDMSEMSTREIQELVEKVKFQGEQLSLLQEELEESKSDDKSDELDKLKKELEETKKQLNQATLHEKIRADETAKKQAINDELAEKLVEYENELEELKNKPVDVAVAEPSADEIERIKAEAEQKVKAELQEKLNKEHEQEVARIKAEYEKELEETKSKAAVQTEPVVTKDNTETFKAYFANAYDAFNKLVTFISNVDDNEKYITKTKQLLTTLQESVEGLEGEK